MNGLDAMLQSIDGGPDVSNSRFLHQLRGVSVQVMAKMESVDESCQLLCVSDELWWTEDRTLRHTAVDGVEFRLLIIIVFDYSVL